MVPHSLPLSLQLATFPSSVPSESQIPNRSSSLWLSLCQPCPCCSLSFPLASPRSHRPHSPVSPGEKPYVCTVPGCGKRFTSTFPSLYKHHVVHTLQALHLQRLRRAYGRPPPWPCTSAAPTAAGGHGGDEQALYGSSSSSGEGLWAGGESGDEPASP